jgi:uncharacterized paraquat-inducible protein A
MQLLAKCPGCSVTLELSLSDADKRKRCGRCGRLFSVPDLEHLQKALAVLRQARSPIYVDEKGRFYG